MNRRQKIIVSVVGIFIVLLALVGITYGYFLTRIQGNTNTTSITVTTADLKLVYGDGNNIITGTNIEPGWTTNGLNGNPDAKTFTIKNEGNATVENFNIYLEDVINSLSRKEDLIYTIECENTTVGTTSTTCDDFEVVENEVNSEDELVFPSVMSIIARDTLDPATATTNAEEHTYTITVTYKNLNIDQSEDMGKQFKAKVNIYDAKTKFLTNEIMTNARKIGTFNYNKTTYIDPSLQDGIERNGITYSIPAEQINGAEERVMSYTFDDYGTSYYYRGNVEDNYVNYAGMCWRIVRIEGDGSVKLLLEDRNEQCNDKEGQDLNNNGTYFTGNWSDNNSYVFGYDSNYKADFINYEGGLADSFESFQTSKLTTTDIEKLKIDEWCYDNTMNDAGDYGAFTRYKLKKPSLKCSGIKITNFKDNSHMYVGTLTADEILFGGMSNYSYLINNYVKEQKENENYIYWWSLSPWTWDEYGEGCIFTTDGYLTDYYFMEDNIDGHPGNTAYIYSRSAVTIKSGSIITEGVGTQNNPYVIG